MINIPDNHIDQYYEMFGTDTFKQIDILQEECAELIKALSKYKRSFGYSLEYLDLVKVNESFNNIVEEITHVAISSEIVAKVLNITEEDINQEIDKRAAVFNIRK